MPVMFHIKIEHKNINPDFANKLLDLTKNQQIFNFWYRPGKSIEYWSPYIFNYDDLLKEFDIPISCVTVIDNYDTPYFL